MMPTYRERLSGNVKQQGEVKALYKKTVSFSKVVDTYADLGWDEIEAVPMPAESGPLKIVVEGAPVEIAGKWTQVWIEEDKFSGPTKAADEATHTASLVAAKEASVRTDRDSRIALTDWTGMSDVTMTADMATYRQALRDITAHANFPDLDAEDWPTA
tara:strand:+ start:79 stop:552 length:474 start_codon:yes stop_codon:yes gene_type:complete